MGIPEFFRSMAQIARGGRPLRHNGFNKADERRMYEQMGLRGDPGFAIHPPTDREVAAAQARENKRQARRERWRRLFRRRIHATT